MYASGTTTDNLQALVRQVVDLLGSGRSGLITDVDGTISPIVAIPQDARVLPRAKNALAQLTRQLELVAVVSGRLVADAQRMVQVDGIVYVGNHGLEVLGSAGPEVLPEARAWVPRVAEVLQQLHERVHIAGVSIEDKGVTASLHYRLAEQPDEARTKLLAVLAQCMPTSGLRLEEGRKVINVLPPLTVTKGSTVRRLAREHGLSALVYLGDDVTDAHAFRELQALRESSPLRTLSIGVVGPETPEHLKQLADAHAPSVEAVAELLCRVTECLENGGTMVAGSSRHGLERRTWPANTTRTRLNKVPTPPSAS